MGAGDTAVRWSDILAVLIYSGSNRYLQTIPVYNINALFLYGYDSVIPSPFLNNMENGATCLFPTSFREKEPNALMSAYLCRRANVTYIEDGSESIQARFFPIARPRFLLPWPCVFVEGHEGYITTPVNKLNSSEHRGSSQLIRKSAAHLQMPDIGHYAEPRLFLNIAINQCQTFFQAPIGEWPFGSQ